MGQKEKLLKRLQERPEDAIAKTIRSLSPRLYKIITLHNGIAGSAGLSIEEVATRLSISPEKAAEYERQAVRQLRHPATGKVIAEAARLLDVEMPLLRQALALSVNRFVSTLGYLRTRWSQ